MAEQERSGDGGVVSDKTAFLQQQLEDMESELIETQNEKTQLARDLEAEKAATREAKEAASQANAARQTLAETVATLEKLVAQGGQSAGSADAAAETAALRAQVRELTEALERARAEARELAAASQAALRQQEQRRTEQFGSQHSEHSEGAAKLREALAESEARLATATELLSRERAAHEQARKALDEQAAGGDLAAQLETVRRDLAALTAEHTALRATYAACVFVLCSIVR